MLRITGLIIIMSIIALIQIPDLVKEKSYRELIAFSTLWLMATVYAAWVLLDLPLVSPFVLITEAVDYLMNAINS